MIDLYTAPTPNGWKVSIMLEEVGLPYQVHAVELGKLEQKQDWFLELNPNGRIPAIVDRDAKDLAVFESGAILVYLAEKTGQLLPTETAARMDVMQWLMFQMGGVGPMQGQAHVFFRYAPEKIQYAIDRYQSETKRLYSVLDRRLRDREYIAGDYSIADIATHPWVAIHEWAGVEIDDMPHLAAWIERVAERPAVLKGRKIPQVDTPANEEDREQQLERGGSKILV